MKTLFLDCFSGISGDMVVGALCDLGVKPSALEWELAKLEIGDFHMHFDRAKRKGIEGIKFGIHEGATHTHAAGEHPERAHSHEPAESHSHQHGDDDSHAHAHDSGSGGSEPEHQYAHGHAVAATVGASPANVGHRPQEHDQDHGNEVALAQARIHDEEAHTHVAGIHHHGNGHGRHAHVHGRTYRQIRALLEQSDLSAFVKQHALSIFNRIAVAEGKIHGMPPEDVHFHEVGALDSIADVVCACVGIEALSVELLYASPLHEGRGWIQCAHGRFPLPAPATLEILQGIVIGETDETHELITPTGAAIVAEFAEDFGPMPRLRVEKIGYGIGTRDLASRPNVLRAVLGELENA